MTDFILNMLINALNAEEVTTRDHGSERVLIWIVSGIFT
jgi:hypothetical protein